MIAVLWGKQKYQSQECNGSWGVGSQGSLFLRCYPPPFLQTTHLWKKSRLSWGAAQCQSHRKGSQVTSHSRNREVERGKKETAKYPEKEERKGNKREEREENHMAGKKKSRNVKRKVYKRAGSWNQDAIKIISAKMPGEQPRALAGGQHTGRICNRNNFFTRALLLFKIQWFWSWKWKGRKYLCALLKASRDASCRYKLTNL